MELESLSSFLMDFGERLLLCGAEISRVEDSISRLCSAYGAHAESFVLTSVIYLTVEWNGESKTILRRIKNYQTDLNLLDKLNDLCRRICADPLPIPEAKKELESVRSGQYGMWLLAGGYAFVAASFSLFFGGCTRDAGISAIIGLLLFFVDRSLIKLQLNRIFSVFLASVWCGFLAAGAMKLGWGVRLESIIIGDIMLLVPGLAITNSVRDMIKGDMLSGILRLLESVLIAVSMTIGFAIPQMLMGII